MRQRFLAVIMLTGIVLFGTAYSSPAEPISTHDNENFTLAAEYSSLQPAINLKHWYEWAHKADLDRQAHARLRTTKANRTVRRPRTAITPMAPQHAVIGGGACGGDLPPCFVLQRESKGDIRVWNGHCYYSPGYLGSNPCGSTASGKWQFLRSTWGTHQDAAGKWIPGYDGFYNAADAPEAVQDAFARQLYNHGCGGSHWGLRNAC